MKTKMKKGEGGKKRKGERGERERIKKVKRGFKTGWGWTARGRRE